MAQKSEASNRLLGVLAPDRRDGVRRSPEAVREACHQSEHRNRIWYNSQVEPMGEGAEFLYGDRT